MRWVDVIDNNVLKNLPFKIELNRWGRIEMSPTSSELGAVPSDIAAELRRRRRGRIISDCRIQTEDGVRVAEVA